MVPDEPTGYLMGSVTFGDVFAGDVALSELQIGQSVFQEKQPRVGLLTLGRERSPVVAFRSRNLPEPLLGINTV
jgi:hypothetical protein